MRRRFPADCNPMWVTGGIGEHDLLALRTREMFALGAMRAWAGTADDLRLLRVACSTARALCLLGYGGDEIGTADAAAAALSECKAQAPGSYGLDHVGMTALRGLVQLLEGQRGECSLADLSRAVLQAMR